MKYCSAKNSYQRDGYITITLNSKVIEVPPVRWAYYLIGKN